MVATCLYYCSCLTDDPVPAKVIADAAMCTESTLKNAYRILFENRTEMQEEVSSLKYTVSSLVY